MNEKYCKNQDNLISLNCIKPNYLKTGDKIALISPSYATPMENIEKTAEVLRNWGFVPVVGPNVGKIFLGQYAGTVDERISDLRWALKDPDIKAIICNRGGYGIIHFINLLSLREFSDSPKWLVGFSDISTLHGLLSRAGIMSIHGTMSSFIANGPIDASSLLLRDLLIGQVPRYELLPHQYNILGKASGTLFGGNLCTFVSNLRTQADATLANNLIIFIEEVGESMHNIDRQMRILQLNGVFNRCNGLIIGEMKNCGDEFTYESIEAMIHDLLKEYHIPLLCGFPAGHGDIKLPLVMGAPVTIDVRNDGATVEFNILGKQIEVKTENIVLPK